MRIYDLKIGGKVYKACCGLRALSVLQKRYGTLEEFEKKIKVIDINSEKETLENEENVVLADTDIEVVLDTAKLFLEEGAKATKTEAIKEIELDAAGDPFGLAIHLYEIYIGSMLPENEESEKN